MKTKFKTKILEVGKLSEGLINNNYLIIFDEDIKDFANEFGFTVKHSPLIDEIYEGDLVEIANKKYKILKISENTNEGLKKETHLSFHINRDFDGPRQILLEGTTFPELKPGIEIKISG